MTWTDALDLVVSRTRHGRFRELCDGSHPGHAAYRALVVRMATGETEQIAETPTPSPGDAALQAYVARHGCCGGA